MTANIFTKPLPRPQFEKHVIGLGLGYSHTEGQVSKTEAEKDKGKVGLQMITGEGVC